MGALVGGEKVGCEVGGAGVVGENGVSGDGVEAPAPAPVPSLGSGVGVGGT